MATSEIDHAPSAKSASRAARHLPRFEQLLAGQTAGAADEPRHPMKEGVLRKERERALVQLGAARPVVRRQAAAAASAASSVRWRRSAHKYRAMSARCVRRTPARPIADGGAE